MDNDEISIEMESHININPQINGRESLVPLSKQSTGDESKVTFEFLIDGMTCVACSSAIENGLKIEFKDKGLVSNENGEYEINVILLVHKMKISFYKKAI